MTQTPDFVQAIYEQLGGNRFMVMTGSKIKYYDREDNSLMIKIIRNKSKAQYLKITLTPMDVYTMTFINIKNIYEKNPITGKRSVQKYEWVTVVEHQNVYDDMLQSIFTEVT